MRDPEKVKQLIIDKVDLTQVMLEYKVGFVFDPRGVSEVQFRCPFHGKDNKPSARLYKETKSCFCWVCRKKWDVISFIRDMEQMKYNEAVAHIISKYRVDLSSIPNEPDILKPSKTLVLDSNVSMIRFERNLRHLRGRISFETYRALCTAFFMVRFSQKKGVDIEESVKKLEYKLEHTCLNPS